MEIDRQKVEIILAERGMTKKQLSISSGVFYSNISELLWRGTCSPNSVGKIAIGLNVKVADIVPDNK